MELPLAIRGQARRDRRRRADELLHAVGLTERDHARLTEAIHDRAVVAGEASPQRPLAMREALDEVAALPQMQREAVILTVIDGQTHQEAAGTLGISHGAVRGLLYRARATLRGVIGVPLGPVIETLVSSCPLEPVAGAPPSDVGT